MLVMEASIRRWRLGEDTQEGVSHAGIWSTVLQTWEQESPTKHHHSPDCSVQWPVSHVELFLITSQPIHHHILTPPSPKFIPPTSLHLYSRLTPSSTQLLSPRPCLPCPRVNSTQPDWPFKNIHHILSLVPSDLGGNDTLPVWPSYCIIPQGEPL